jgi:hypothetical protein
MKVKQLTEIEIGAVTWKVSQSEAEIAAKIEMIGGPTQENTVIAGLTDCFSGAILVHPGQSESQQRNTLWHELFHACYDVIGGMRLGPEPSEDDVIMQVSGTLLATIRNNPALVLALLADSISLETIQRREI